MWRSKLRHFLWREMSRVVALHNLASIRHLAGQQESLDEFAFAADGKTGKPFEPFAHRNIRFRVEPAGQQKNLFVRDIPLTHSCQTMGKQRQRQTLAADFRPEAGGRRTRA